MHVKKIAVIGAGFAGMAASAVLAKEGYNVVLIEKNDQPGGRCRIWENEDFLFDMGPSWYWMPDVFERFYNRFGKTTADFYELIRLNPSYQVFFEDESAKIPADYDEFKQLIESWEPGSGKKLDQFFKDAKYKYEVGMRDLVYKPSFSILEFADVRIAQSLFRINMFSSLQKEVRTYFKDRRVQELLEFPVLFLGAKADDTPALYSLMNYADVKLGTWYPKGGMHNVAKAFETIAKDQGVEFFYNENVESFSIKDKVIDRITTNKQEISDVDIVISGADYHHTETLLPKEFQSYSSSYWESRKLSPSALLFYVGVSKKIDGLEHHNLFFDADFALHSKEIYETNQWPEKPLFYVCTPSKTDAEVAPKDMENLFILIPIATNLEENEEIHEHYFNQCLDRLEEKTKTNIRDHILFKRSFGINDFKSSYNSFKGNAYGLANTLGQTAVLKPKMKSNKLKNLYFCGQLTVPGPGMPPSVISGQVISDYILSKIYHK